MSPPAIPAFMRRVETPEAYRQVLDIRNGLFDHDPITLAEAESGDRERPKERQVTRYLVGDDAFAVIGKPRQASQTMFVQALGRNAEDPNLDLSYEYLLEEARVQGGDRAITMLLSRQARDVARLEGLGFKIDQINPISSLDVATFEPSVHEASISAEIVPFTLLPDKLGPDWKHKLWRLEMDLHRDVPNPSPFEETPYDLFVSHLDEPLYRLDTRFAAVVDGELAGMSEWNHRLANPKIAMTHLTGVRPEFRRRGFARALKVAAITEAKRQGIRHLYADNEKNNPMYLLNLQLGFRHVTDILIMERPL
ncbi:N-acetyltransferase [bacterium]|nr:MAG: N-acetyltransferase [bacterium]